MSTRNREDFEQLVQAELVALSLLPRQAGIGSLMVEVERDYAVYRVHAYSIGRGRGFKSAVVVGPRDDDNGRGPFGTFGGTLGFDMDGASLDEVLGLAFRRLAEHLAIQEVDPRTPGQADSGDGAHEEPGPAAERPDEHPARGR